MVEVQQINQIDLDELIDEEMSIVDTQQSRVEEAMGQADKENQKADMEEINMEVAPATPVKSTIKKKKNKKSEYTARLQQIRQAQATKVLEIKLADEVLLDKIHEEEQKKKEDEKRKTSTSFISSLHSGSPDQKSMTIQKKGGKHRQIIQEMQTPQETVEMKAMEVVDLFELDMERMYMQREEKASKEVE